MFLGRTDLLIKVFLEPESNNTLSSLRLRKLLIVFTVHIVAGVSNLLFVIFGTGIEYSISSVTLYISMSDSLKALPTERSE
jgi:hypothetical protein